MFDQSRLQELEADFGAEELSEIIHAFLAEAEEAVADVARLVPDGPAAEWRGRLHFLKGCALNMGARALAELCEELEGVCAPYPESGARRLEVAFRAVRSHLSGAGLRQAG